MKTKVQFLVNETGEEEYTKDVFAFFPDDDYSSELYGSVMKECYAHIGQHTACSVAYAKESREAIKEEYKPLYDELVSIGYDLEIIKR